MATRGGRFLRGVGRYGRMLVDPTEVGRGLGQLASRATGAYQGQPTALTRGAQALRAGFLGQAPAPGAAQSQPAMPQAGAAEQMVQPQGATQPLGPEYGPMQDALERAAPQMFGQQPSALGPRLSFAQQQELVPPQQPQYLPTPSQLGRGEVALPGPNGAVRTGQAGTMIEQLENRGAGSFMGGPTTADYAGFRENVRQNAITAGLAPEGRGSRDEQIRSLQGRMQRTRDTQKRQDIQARIDQLTAATGRDEAALNRQRDVGVAGAQGENSRIIEQMRAGVAAGKDAAMISREIIENGTPILGPDGQPKVDPMTGKVSIRPYNEQERAQIIESTKAQVGVQTGGAPGLRGGGDMNGDGQVSTEEAKYNQISATLKANPNMPAADRKRFSDERKRLEGILFPQA